MYDNIEEKLLYTKIMGWSLLWGLQNLFLTSVVNHNNYKVQVAPERLSVTSLLGLDLEELT